MNRKLTNALLVLLVLLTMSACRKKKDQPTETTAATTATEATVAAETTEAAGFANEALEGEPAPFGDENVIIISGNDANQSQSGSGSGTSGNKKPSSGSNTGSSTNKKPSSGSSSGSSGSSSGSSGNNNTSSGGNSGNDKPQSGATETLPPEVDVNMGVVKGEEAPSIDEEVPATTQPPKPTEPTKPSQPENTGSALGNDFEITKMTYESYNAMSGQQQAEVIGMFGSPDDFMRWYKAAEAQYKAEHPDIEIGADGSINAGDLLG